MRTFLLFMLFLGLLCSCGGRDAATTGGVGHVDSAAEAAPDTLSASMDTSSRKDTAHAGRGRDSGGDKNLAGAGR